MPGRWNLKNFMMVGLPRLLLIAMILAATYWILRSPDSPFRQQAELPELEEPEQAVAKAMPITSEQLWTGDGQWNLGSMPWAIGQQRFSSRTQAEQAWADLSNLPVASEQPLQTTGDSIAANIPDDARFELSQFAELFDEETTVIDHSEQLKTRSVMGEMASMRLVTTSDDRFITLRILAPDGDGWKVISIHAATDDAGANREETLELPEGVEVVGSRRNANGTLSAQFLLSSIASEQLLSAWKQAGWRVNPDRTKINEYIVQRGDVAYSVSISDNHKDITVIRLER
ncbi:MAG: hypothetical protein R3C05_00385 [Pirellulaceae bacterium]